MMRQRLPKEVYRSLLRTIDRGEPLDPAVADVVAASMKESAGVLQKAKPHPRPETPAIEDRAPAAIEAVARSSS